MRRLIAAMLCVLLAGFCACGRVGAEPTTQATESLIKCPASYKDASEAYWPILDDVYRADQDDVWRTRGYAVVDINSDDIVELLLLYKAGNEVSVSGIYTLNGEEPVCLAVISRYEQGLVTVDGTVHINGERGESAWLYSYRLDPGAVELTLLADWHAEAEQVDNPQSPMQFTFIPIEQ